MKKDVRLWPPKWQKNFFVCTILDALCPPMCLNKCLQKIQTTTHLRFDFYICLTFKRYVCYPLIESAYICLAGFEYLLVDTKCTFCRYILLSRSKKGHKM